ncbi:MAG: YraN family protein [Actinobacteria bacterium]|nr:YraN family protein [Actinomycetota bacterium]
MSGHGRPDPRRSLGQRGETLVAQWYERRGYTVLDRNWRCRDGEIDLVLAVGRVLVFCEVKTRTSTAFGTPAEAVTLRKQARLRRLASRWLDTHPGRARSLRFDVASVIAQRGGPAIVEVLEAAF